MAKVFHNDIFYLRQVTSWLPYCNWKYSMHLL